MTTTHRTTTIPSPTTHHHHRPHHPTTMLIGACDLMARSSIYTVYYTVSHSYCYLDPRNDGRIGPPRLKIKLPRIRRRKNSQLSATHGLGGSSESSDDGLIQTDWNQLSGRSPAIKLGALRPGSPGACMHVEAGLDATGWDCRDAVGDGDRRREQPNGAFAFNAYEADSPAALALNNGSPFGADDSANSSAGRPSATSMSRLPFGISDASDARSSFELGGR